MFRLIPVGAALVLAGCTTQPVVVFDQPGVTTARLSTDYGRCVAEAERQAPRSVQNQTNFGTNVGVGVGTGNRNWNGRSTFTDFTFSVDTRRVDVNAGRRVGLVQQCMSSKGYTPRQLPGCSNQQRASATANSEARQPQITQQSCGTVLSGIGPVVVTP
ncbi:MAG: hypothetical protein AAGF50_02890 [Pseudomonadota bacterium]